MLSQLLYTLTVHRKPSSEAPSNVAYTVIVDQLAQSEPEEARLNY